MIVVVIFRGEIVKGWQLSSSVPLLVAVGAVLASIWMPLFSGVMQGRQDFFWLGWSILLGSVARVGAAMVLVMAFHAGATGMLLGALIGVGFSGVVGIWRTRDLWSLPSEPFDSKGLLNEILPLVLGFGVCQFLFTTDTMFAS